MDKDRKPMNAVFNTSLDKIRKRKAIDDAHQFFDNTMGRGGNPTRRLYNALDTVQSAAELGGMIATPMNSTETPRAVKEAENLNKVNEMYDKKVAGDEGRRLSNVFAIKPDTNNLSANEFKQMRDGFASVNSKLKESKEGKKIGFDPNSVLEDFNVVEEKVPANDMKEIAKAQSGSSLTLSRDQKMDEVRRVGLQSISGLEKYGNELYKELMKTPVQEVSVKQRKDTGKLKYSTKDSQGNITVKGHNNKSDKSDKLQRVGKLTESVMNNMDNVVSMMDYLDKNNPEEAAEIRRRLGSDGELKLSSSQDKLNYTNKHSRNMDVESTSSVIKDKRTENPQTTLQNQFEPIIKQISNTYESVYKDDPETLLKYAVKLGYKGAKDPRAIAAFMANAAVQFMFSDETPEEKEKIDGRTYDAVNMSMNQFNGPTGQMAAQHGMVILDDWFDKITDGSLRAVDKKTYNEMKQLYEDAKNGNQVLLDSGNTNPVMELLTNPKYVRMLNKYQTPESKAIRG